MKPFVLFALVSAACAAAPATTVSPSNASWKEIQIAWTYGPCPRDGQSCHQTLTVHPDGGLVASETPNGGDAGPEPVRRFASLEAQEVREMNRIVTRELVAQLGSLPCASGNDATVTLAIDDHHQDVSSCALSQSPSPVHDLVALLARHRFASTPAPPTHPIVPSGVGDPCDTATGCARGLQCVASPCVVAPCTSGSCQKL
jgi:hypothetical protein